MGSISTESTRQSRTPLQLRNLITVFNAKTWLSRYALENCTSRPQESYPPVDSVEFVYRVEPSPPLSCLIGLEITCRSQAGADVSRPRSHFPRCCSSQAAGCNLSIENEWYLLLAGSGPSLCIQGLTLELDRAVVAQLEGKINYRYLSGA